MRWIAFRDEKAATTSVVVPPQSPPINADDKKKVVDDKKGEPPLAADVAAEASSTLPVVSFKDSLDFPERQKPRRILPFSVRLIGQVSGVHYCTDCGDSSNNNRLKGIPASSDADRDSGDEDVNTLAFNSSLDYDIQALRQMRPGSVASPLVVAPLLIDVQTRQHHSIVERIVTEYIAACHFYGRSEERINAGVLTTLRYSLPSLRVAPAFGDADMLPLAEILLRYANGPLRFIKRFDFSTSTGITRAERSRLLRTSAAATASPGLSGHGALTLSKVLQISRHVEEVFLQRNPIGPFGASAIFVACLSNPESSVRRLAMRRCRVGERGALVLAEWLHKQQRPPTSGEATAPPPQLLLMSLRDVDLSSNFIGYRASAALERALERRAVRYPNLPPLSINIEGNLVFQEIMNGITHGLGIIFAAVGTYFLMQQAQGHGLRNEISCAVYSLSLIVLYTSSTLYHSFFSLQHTKYIFQVIDKCAIYILIAGSYTPFLQIITADKPQWSVGLLAFLWICCILGIGVEAAYPIWKHRPTFSLVMYLGMGWSVLMCLPDMVESLPRACVNIMVAGGVAYTVGVPFFVRNNNLDHALWHCFVLTASIFHWFGIYWYVATWPESDTRRVVEL